MKDAPVRRRGNRARAQRAWRRGRWPFGVSLRCGAPVTERAADPCEKLWCVRCSPRRPRTGCTTGSALPRPHPSHREEQSGGRRPGPAWVASMRPHRRWTSSTRSSANPRNPPERRRRGGITCDTDPVTGTVAYNRGGEPLSAETTVGHRPSPDATPAPPGTHPGARPALLPAAPGSHLPGITAATSQGLRTDRAKRMIETRLRREVLFQRSPTADPQWAEAIITADPLWGPDEDWKLLIDQTTTEADPPAPLG